MTEGRIPPAPHHLCDLRQAPLFKAGLFVTACKSRSFRSRQKPTRFRSRQKPTRYAELQNQCDFGSALFSEFGGVHLWNGIGSWKQIKEKWGKLTDDDLTQINGKREQFEGKIQERYGLAKDQARKDVDTWLNSLD